MPSWQEFGRKQDAVISQQADDVADTCATVFTTAAGKELLRHLYAMYVDRRTQPGAPEAMLREHEAERRLVANLEKLRDLGLERRAAKPPA